MKFWTQNIDVKWSSEGIILPQEVCDHSKDLNFFGSFNLSWNNIPLFSVWSSTNFTASVTSFSLVTSSCSRCIRFEDCFRSDGPGPSTCKQPAKTTNPKRSNCLATWKPKPLSQPVIVTSICKLFAVDGYVLQQKYEAKWILKITKQSLGITKN